MSSVQGEKECPKCGGVMLYDFNCGTIEEHSTCCRCGLRQHWVPLWNEDGSMKLNEDGDCIGDCKETLGYGTAFVMMALILLSNLLATIYARRSQKKWKVS